MWFRMSFNLLHTSVFADAAIPRGKGDRPETRTVLLLQMLCATVEGATFESPRYLSGRFGVSIVNADIVWNLCMKHGVFTQVGTEFSLFDWMAKQGIIGKVGKQKVVAKQVAPQNVADRLARITGNVG